MYEQFGIPGLVAFKKTVNMQRAKVLLIIGDIKRGDIGSTSEAYAVGHVGKVAVGSKTYDEKICEQSIHILDLMESVHLWKYARRRRKECLS